ncbi:DUF6415 family natural product biosynthesis protein [Streptomyces sp. E11-3]|uniref:DUF6415 family natural product biosynthesis protein n=1 Tax=Streptomyces sp. E11-3 TaxID=3110112 RepID=UPI0039814E16
MSATDDVRTSEPPISAIREVIEEGLDATRILPPYERLVELDKMLRAELDRLMPIVQQHTDTLDPGTVQRYGQQCVLDDTREVLARDLGVGLRSAAVQVHRLARHCLWLTKDVEEQS